MSAGWNTIESDAGVFTYLLENLGVKDVQFEELVELDADHLKAQSPVYGVIFLFKYPTGSQPKRTDGEPRDGTFDHAAAQHLFFAAQTIQNACGTQALLSVLLNQHHARIDIGPQLAEFKDFTAGFPAELRGEALSNSALIRAVHNSFARSSPFVDETQRSTTAADDDADDGAVYHFVAYAPIGNTLYELDGLQAAPIAHGRCAFDDFPDKVIPVLQRRIGRYPPSEIRFNLLAMVEDPRVRAREVGDWEALEAERRKRDGWRWENALRRHNFVGFVAEVLRGVVRGKVAGGPDAYAEWVEEAKGRTAARGEERARRRVGGGGEEG